MAGPEEADRASRLPPGRHGHSREYVSESQRERLLNAVVEVVAREGYEATTIGQLTESASVSRRTFYEHFSGKEECFSEAYEMVAAHLCEGLREAGRDGEWSARVRDQLAVMLTLFAADPGLARFVLMEPLAVGGVVAARHRELLRQAAATLRPEGAEGGALADARERALLGGISTLVVRRLREGGGERLPALLPELHELVLTSYVSRGEARRLAS